MTILIVAMAQSIHTARWISSAVRQGMDVHLFPAQDAGLHAELDGVRVHDALFHPPRRPTGQNQITSDVIPRWLDSTIIGRARGYPLKYTRRLVLAVRPKLADPGVRLAAVIRRLHPEVIHCLEVTLCGGLGLRARENLGQFPCPWIVSNWGSELYLHTRLSATRQIVRGVISKCDFLIGECCRDAELARVCGFTGQMLDIIPGAGGIDLSSVASLAVQGSPSSRRVVAIKGYQGVAGRALVALRAVEMTADLFRHRGYRVAVYSADTAVAAAAELLASSTGISVEVVPQVGHREILELHGRSRVSVGLSISDAISTSVLEAMTMGSFPVQSYTSCAGEDRWLRDGETGLLVHPDDPADVAAALRRALTDDALVDAAAVLNATVIRVRLDTKVVDQRIGDLYHRAANAIRVDERYVV